jgi:hypothetical protein
MLKKPFSARQSGEQNIIDIHINAIVIQHSWEITTMVQRQRVGKLVWRKMAANLVRQFIHLFYNSHTHILLFYVCSLCNPNRFLYSVSFSHIWYWCQPQIPGWRAHEGRNAAYRDAEFYTHNYLILCHN